MEYTSVPPAQSMEGAVDKLALSGGDVEVALRRPVFSASASLRTTLRRSRGVKQDGIEGFGQGRAKTRPSKWVRATLLMPQRLMLACSTFTRLAENSLARMPPALPIRAAWWFSIPGGGNVHHPFGLPVIGEQGGDRQHRTAS